MPFTTSDNVDDVRLSMRPDTVEKEASVYPTVSPGRKRTCSCSKDAATPVSAPTWAKVETGQVHIASAKTMIGSLIIDSSY
jgi:hypothetical protein